MIKTANGKDQVLLYTTYTNSQQFAEIGNAILQYPFYR